ncbi:alpha/beta fold hydrolase [Streptomyces bambusae]|uniref:alpha/beta hydrolase family protein n=1 Tax=Streptomyces bambusae TaxID=1550616 RepID=UPI001CFCD6DF|nr:alpha/beta fold hydrolase [Streptomyces bambusae]MCB5168834.1 alpha/beta fold hydrolase [Streptomyces bambusae]
MVFTADADGRCQVFTWDARTGRARQVTDRPGGTLHCAVDHDAHVWWFDEDADGHGQWQFRPFHGDAGTDRPGLEGVPAGAPRGLGLTPGGTVAVATAAAGATSLHIGQRGGPPRAVARFEGHARLAGISPDGLHLAVGGPAGSDRAVTVLSPDGTVRAVLRGDGDGGELWALGFRPAGTGRDTELLLVRRRRDRYVLGVWRPGTGARLWEWCGFDTEITASWYPDRDGVLIRQERHGRSLLHRADPGRRTVGAVPTPPGTLLAAAARPDGDVHYLWTSAAQPPRMVSTAGTALPPLGTVDGAVPGEHRELWTPGPDGPVHSLLALPEGLSPAPAVFLVHGGPADHDRDAYDGVVHSLVASGFAVVRVNYRGSTGYGPRWRHAYPAGVGLTQVQDLVSVRTDLVRRGLVRADATALWGTSWGGYLALLAAGAAPGPWRAVVAVKPVADCAAAHRAGTPALRALDERLFGGTPEQVPEAYARSSPVSYVAQVRAPLLVVAAERDDKCPPEQVRRYLDALTRADVRHEAMWLDTGHDGYDGRHHVAVLRRALGFLDRELRRRGRPGRPAPDPGSGSAQTSRSVRSGVPEGRLAPAPGDDHPSAPERGGHHAEGRHQQRPADG